MLGGLGNMAQMMKQVTQLKQQFADMQSELAKINVSATAGGGMVTVVMSGAQEVKSITIDPSVVDPNDLTMLEDLIVAAVNEARKRAQEAAQQTAQDKMGGLFTGLGIDPSQLPGL